MTYEETSRSCRVMLVLFAEPAPIPPGPTRVAALAAEPD